jgi:2-polyprenyl-3-methyl-5-hydroxy-6-metoxy-1,4-benzoquinol methylase
LLKSSLSEFHSGYRVYSVEALQSIPFDLNTNDFHFDTEIIIQLLYAAKRIREVPIPTYYGDEICHVNGLKYAANVARATLKARVQQLGLLYERKFDVVPHSRENAQYVPKLGYDSPHTLTLASIKPGSRVLDLGCAGGSVAGELRKRGSYVVGVDILPLQEGVELDGFHLHDLNEGLPDIRLSDFDYVLLLDVIEHLRSPERFLEDLYAEVSLNPDAKVVISTGNIAFGMTRLLLLAGQFNYGKRGILDLTHTRLFTFSTLRRVLDGAGFRVIELRGVPAPFPLALGDSGPARALMSFSRHGIRLWKRFFAYQIYAIAQPRPSLDLLLRDAHVGSETRAGSIAPGSLTRPPTRNR